MRIHWHDQPIRFIGILPLGELRPSRKILLQPAVETEPCVMLHSIFFMIHQMFVDCMKKLLRWSLHPMPWKTLPKTNSRSPLEVNGWKTSLSFLLAICVVQFQGSGPFLFFLWKLYRMRWCKRSTFGSWKRFRGGWWWCHLWWDELWILGVVHCPLPTHTRGAFPNGGGLKMRWRLGVFLVGMIFVEIQKTLPVCMYGIYLRNFVFP